MCPQLVKDIRRLVDNGEFIANKHCSSQDVKLMVTLLLELTTDHTREVGTIILGLHILYVTTDHTREV